MGCHLIAGTADCAYPQLAISGHGDDKAPTARRGLAVGVVTLRRVAHLQYEKSFHDRGRFSNLEIDG